jgi:histidine ammonia-lyase
MVGSSRSERGSRPSGPLTFCNLSHLLSALEDALAYARALVTIELNASDSNPIVLPAESAPVAGLRAWLPQRLPPWAIC